MGVTEGDQDIPCSIPRPSSGDLQPNFQYHKSSIIAQRVRPRRNITGSAESPLQTVEETSLTQAFLSSRMSESSSPAHWSAMESVERGRSPGSIPVTNATSPTAFRTSTTWQGRDRGHGFSKVRGGSEPLQPVDTLPIESGSSHHVVNSVLNSKRSSLTSMPRGPNEGYRGSENEGVTTSGSFSSTSSHGQQAGGYRLHSRESSSAGTGGGGSGAIEVEDVMSGQLKKVPELDESSACSPVSSHRGSEDSAPSMSGIPKHSHLAEGTWHKAPMATVKEDSGKSRSGDRSWSWRKLGFRKSSKSRRPQNPLDEQLTEEDGDGFRERSPLEDAANLPEEIIPDSGYEDEILPDLPVDISMQSSRFSSASGSYIGSDHGRSLNGAHTPAPHHREQHSAGSLAGHFSQKSMASTMLLKIDQMRREAEVAERKLLAAERMVNGIMAGDSGSVLSVKPGTSHSTELRPMSRYSSSSERGLIDSRGHLEATTRSLAAMSMEPKVRSQDRSVMNRFQVYTWEEIKVATNYFDKKLGEGGFGTVYGGVLNHIPVAVKVMKNIDGINAEYEFQQEVEVLGELRHPHIMMLLGCCPEKYSLVYEFMANGSLEDRLKCLNGTPPLMWYIRLRICAEIASALLNLHTRPEPIVHRDLKPGNVLLDKNFVAKLGDVGLAKIMPQTGGDNTYLHDSKPVGTLAYVDPEFQRTGDFSPKSDVYAFGIMLLDVLTGRKPQLYEGIEDAVEDGDLDGLSVRLDASAGDWPVELAMEVARLAVRCSEMKRKKRPDLALEVMPILDVIRNEAAAAEEAVQKGKDQRRKAPSCLFCPITQEIMVNPVIASDGHTYEAKAIKQWLKDRDQSPITNQRLPNKDLIPNIAISTMIKEWSGA